MIPYEELCAALERYAADRGDVPPVGDLAPLGDTTGQHTMPPVGMGGDDDQTNVGLQPVYDDKSNELDIGDVLSDEEAPKN